MNPRKKKKDRVFVNVIRREDKVPFIIDVDILEEEPHRWMVVKNKAIEKDIEDTILAAEEDGNLDLPNTAEEYKAALDAMGVSYHANLGLPKLMALWNDNQ